MDSLFLAINVVVPLFLLMALGYILNLTHMLDGKTLTVINKLVFKVFLPSLLFYNVYRTDLKSALQPSLIFYSVTAVLIVTAALFIIIPLAEKDNKKRGVIIQGIFRSNFALYGIPVATAILGEGNVGVTSVLIAIIVPLFNVLAVITLELFQSNNTCENTDLKNKDNLKKTLKIFKGIASNPLILASLTGIVFLLAGIRLPKPIETAVCDLSRLATPLSLIVLGGTFKFRRVSGNIKQIAIITLGKLILVPCAIIFTAVKIGFNGAAIVTLLSMTASPTAVSSYTMAEEMGADGELAGQGIVFTTAISVVTVFIFVFVLGEIGAI